MTEYVISPLAPTFKGFAGGEAVHPEYVGVSCDDCGRDGYVAEETAADDDATLRCEVCADGE